MCYEFVHCCNDSLKEKLASVLSPETYFLWCMGEINYLYVNTSAAASESKELFAKQQVKLYRLQVAEMMSVIDFPGLERERTLHGNMLLLDSLRKMYASTNNLQLV